MYKTLYELWKEGSLNYLNEKGALHPRVLPSCKIYALFLSYRAENKYEDSIIKTAEALDISERTVKRGISLVSK